MVRLAAANLTVLFLATKVDTAHFCNRWQGCVTERCYELPNQRYFFVRLHLGKLLPL